MWAYWDYSSWQSQSAVFLILYTSPSLSSFLWIFLFGDVSMGALFQDTLSLCMPLHIRQKGHRSPFHANTDTYAHRTRESNITHPHTPQLTVRENLMFSAELRLPASISYEEKVRRVSNVSRYNIMYMCVCVCVLVRCEHVCVVCRWSWWSKSFQAASRGLDQVVLCMQLEDACGP